MITCEDPDGLFYKVNEEATFVEGDQFNSKCKDFTYNIDLSTDTQSIVINSANINSFHEGNYNIKIEGWNQYYTATIGEIEVSAITIYADCADSGSAVTKSTG